jgi:hypothetical protein
MVVTFYCTRQHTIDSRSRTAKKEPTPFFGAIYCVNIQVLLLRNTRKMKGLIRRRKFPTDDDLERCVRDSVRSIPKNWNSAAIQKLPERWQRCTDLGGEYVDSATV